mmetsp:Transcript_9673/g.21815  ORF Transcript_9673/g.21815 Transcript_9673/m.21815 type:complete len:491 (+) Transcript_9673:360-1832(+)|eukprot:CAMPEP_0172313110 /NCGR_PEP_ID=MMETSP1058-20130122/19425_1 /TAXON_ID=83371 /ORGANISM="Detonula confervacea, Strain CCMP 353" /LENGTH=490 /DNA_ID=CAMNT_0013026711 /DNA_START=229 /DNA_END=1701 /DNA_ORIENTATION=-
MVKKQTKQEEDASKEDSKYPSILPSMPPDSQLPAPQAAHPPSAQMQGYPQPDPPGYVQPLATYPPTEPGGMRAGGNFSSSSPLGHPVYTVAPPGTGTYMPLQSLGDSSATGMSHVQSYPGYGSYQSPAYGYDSSGQGYPYDTSTSMVPYSSQHGAAGSQTGYTASQVPTDSSYSGIMGPDQTYGGGAQGHPSYYWTPQYQGQQDHGYYEAPRRGRGHHQGSLPKPNKSYAKNPGKPYYNDKNRSGPEGSNLFIFHVPNDMTNNELFGLFGRFGTVLSAKINTEAGTGRGKGYGFVTYDSPVSAADAIHHLHGYQIRGKRLKVQYKSRAETHGQDRRRHTPPSGSVVPKQDYSMPSQLHQPEARRLLPPAGFGVPTQEYAMPSQPRQREVCKDQSHYVGFVPLPEDAGPSQPHAHEVRGDEPSYSGIMPVQEYAGPPETHRRGSTPVLPPIGNLSEGSEPGDNQGVQRNPTSPSPLDDLQGIGNALPDPEK